jgi:DNA ligase D-like protein (predicted polymerase)
MGTEREGVSLTHLDEPLFDGADATKRDLVDYLDAVSGLILPELRGRPLSVIRVRAGQQPFMQKNLPDYAPPWVGSVTLWAESSRREVRYALCDDRRTLLWLANQRAVEYHPTLSLAGDLGRPTHLVLDIDPPPGGPFGHAVAAAHLIRRALDDLGLAGAVKTSGSKGLHIYVPVQASGEEAAAATRAIVTRAARLDPALATTAFIKEDREGKVFLDSTRAFGATVAAAYSPRVRPGVPVSFPVRWDDLDSVVPGDFTVHSVLGLLDGHTAWAGELPAPQVLSPELVEEGRSIPVARVQAMHEGKRRKRAREAQLGAQPLPGWLPSWLVGVPAFADLWPGWRRAGQRVAVGRPHAVQDQGQVPVPQLGGARWVGELDRRHQLERQRDVVQHQVGPEHVADQAEELLRQLG